MWPTAGRGETRTGEQSAATHKQPSAWRGVADHARVKGGAGHHRRVLVGAVPGADPSHSWDGEDPDVRASSEAAGAWAHSWDAAVAGEVAAAQGLTGARRGRGGLSVAAASSDARAASSNLSGGSSRRRGGAARTIRRGVTQVTVGWRALRCPLGGRGGTRRRRQREERDGRGQPAPRRCTSVTGRGAA